MDEGEETSEPVVLVLQDQVAIAWPSLIWHPPMPYIYSWRTHDGYAMVLADGGTYPRRWLIGPKVAGLTRS